jgi:hypothetical protein
MLCADLLLNQGKPMSWGEETAVCTHRSSRGRGSGMRVKSLRDNDGKILFPAGMATTCEDPSYRVQPKGMGGSRIGA